MEVRVLHQQQCHRWFVLFRVLFVRDCLESDAKSLWDECVRPHKTIQYLHTMTMENACAQYSVYGQDGMPLSRMFQNITQPAKHPDGLLAAGRAVHNSGAECVAQRVLGACQRGARGCIHDAEERVGFPVAIKGPHLALHQVKLPAVPQRRGLERGAGPRTQVCEARGPGRRPRHGKQDAHNQIQVADHFVSVSVCFLSFCAFVSQLPCDEPKQSQQFTPGHIAA